MKEELISADITGEVDVPENQGTEKKKKKILKKIVAPKSTSVQELGIKEGQIIFVEQLEEELPYIEITDDIRGQIIDFLKQEEITSDKQVHKFAKSMGMNEHQLEEELYKILQAFFRGGVSFNNKVTEDMVDQSEFKKGIEVEYEHCNRDNPYAIFISKKIDLDHLGEIQPNPRDSLYYSYLDAMEKRMEKDIEG